MEWNASFRWKHHRQMHLICILHSECTSFPSTLSLIRSQFVRNKSVRIHTFTAQQTRGSGMHHRHTTHNTHSHQNYVDKYIVECGADLKVSVYSRTWPVRLPYYIGERICSTIISAFGFSVSYWISWHERTHQTSSWMLWFWCEKTTMKHISCTSL